MIMAKGRRRKPTCWFSSQSKPEKQTNPVKDDGQPSKSRLPFNPIIALRRNDFPGVQRPGLPTGRYYSSQGCYRSSLESQRGKECPQSWLNQRRGNWEGRAREVGTRKREPQVSRHKVSAALFPPTVGPVSGSGIASFHMFCAGNSSFPRRKRKGTCRDFSAKNLLFRQGEFRVFFSLPTRLSARLFRMALFREKANLRKEFPGSPFFNFRNQEAEAVQGDGKPHLIKALEYQTGGK